MGALIDLVMAEPIANAALIARELAITPCAAQTLVHHFKSPPAGTGS